MAGSGCSEMDCVMAFLVSQVKRKISRSGLLKVSFIPGPNYLEVKELYYEVEGNAGIEPYK